MAKEESASAPLLKDWFDEKRYRLLSRQLKGLESRFDQKTFLRETLVGLDERSLMQRLGRTSEAVALALPGNYKRQLEVLRELAPQIDHAFVGCFLSDFVARYGRHDPALSLPALAFFTRFGSAEFAVRFFLIDDQPGTLKVMKQWAGDENEHVRRLSSEGCRPRLPWGQQLRALVANPSPLSSILDTLRADPSLYVRKSVANNLNDISKDHPQWVIAKLKDWGQEKKETAWIAKHAARTLIKKGHAEALALFGFHHKPQVKTLLSLSPGRLALGESLRLTVQVTSCSARAQQLVIDYVVYYVKANGQLTPKVFKWCEMQLLAGETRTLHKTQAFRPLTTRQHYPGSHRVALQINGQTMSEEAFSLVVRSR